MWGRDLTIKFFLMQAHQISEDGIMVTCYREFEHSAIYPHASAKVPLNKAGLVKK
jgi:hypothetical protein